MALFKSKEERRIERDIKIRQGIRRIEKSIAEQNKFSDEFVKNARQAKQIGDQASYQFIRNSLKKTATIKKMLERQLLAVKNALLIKRQAEAAADFADAMKTMAGRGQPAVRRHGPGQDADGLGEGHGPVAVDGRADDDVPGEHRGRAPRPTCRSAGRGDHATRRSTA